MKRMELWKRVKKLRMQKISWDKISKICEKTKFECKLAYYNHFGIKMKNTKLNQLIRQKQKIHIYGDSGVGKTFIVSKTLEGLDTKNVIISYPRSEEDLLKDFGDLPFQDDIEAVFVIEGDNYYWKKYGLVKRLLTESEHCVIIISVDKETPTKNITKYTQQIKIHPPTRSDVLKYIKRIDPDWKGNILDIYDKDWRVIKRRLSFGELHDDQLIKPKWLDSKVLSYKLVKGNAKPEDFDNCTHPISFVINWIGYNAKTFWTGKSLAKNLEIISWCDANKYKTKEIYIRNALLELVPSFRKGYMKFPPWKKKKNNKFEEEDIVVRKVKLLSKKKKRKPQKKKEEEYKGLQSELGDFLML